MRHARNAEAITSRLQRQQQRARIRRDQFGFSDRPFAATLH